MADQNDKTIRSGSNADGGNDKTIRSGNPGSDKTIRTGSQTDKTIRSGSSDSSDKTIRSGSGKDESKTIRSGGADDKTIRSGDATPDSTIRSGGGDPDVIGAGKPKSDDKTIRSKDRTISSGESGSPKTLDTIEEEGYFTLKGSKHKVLKTLSENTGEATIYLVELNTKKLVLKLYNEGIAPTDNLLDQLRNVRHDDLITLLDFGYYDSGGYGSNRFYEIMEYAEGGSVEDVLPVRDFETMRQIIAETTNGLNYLHENKIIHQDIKPGNLFYRDKERKDIVIGDFGISTMMEEGQTFAKTAKNLSRLFSAPEISYTMGETSYLLPAYDWYSLGITILNIWYGKNLFHDQPEAFWEQILPRLKATNKIVENDYIDIKGMDERILNIIKGLTLVDENHRWGKDEVNRWLKGEKVEVYTEAKVEISTAFNFDKSKGLVANNAEELGKLMLFNPKLGADYLYAGVIAGWFKDNKDPKNQLAMEKVVKTFSRKQMSGLAAAAYTLNSSLPYISVDHKECSSGTQIADALERNKDHYKKALLDKQDPLYIYLSRYGQVVKQIQLAMQDEKEGPDVGLQTAIFIMDKKRPLRLDHKADKDGKTVSSISNITELEDFINSHFEDGKKYFFNGIISAWLKYKKEYTNLYNTAERMRREYENVDQDAGLMGLRWAMNKKLGYLGLQKDPVKLFTQKEIAAYMFKHFDAYVQLLQYKHDFLYVYMSAQNWKNVINFIQHSFDKKKHRNKIGPYDMNVALMKSIRAMDKDFAFTFENGVSVQNPEEVLKNLGKIKKEIRQVTENPTSSFCAWISTYFHENPFGKFDEKGAYEKQLRDYTEFMGKIKAKTDAVQRYHNARGAVQKVYNQNRKKDQSYLITRMGATIFIALLLLFAGIKLFTVGIPIDENPMSGNPFKVSSTYYFIMAVIGVVLTFLGDDDFSFRTTFIGGPIIGLIAGVILYLIAYFVVGLLIAILPLVVFVLVLAAAAGAGWLMWHNSYTNAALRKALYRDTSEWDLIWGPLQYAYSKKQEYENPKLKEMDNYKSERKRSWRRLLLAISIGVIILGAPAAYYAGAIGHVNQSALYDAVSSPLSDGQFLLGKWEGNFEGRDLSMNFTSVDGNNVNGTMTVVYNKPIKQEFTGKYNPSKKQLRLKDQLNIKLKGTYIINFSENAENLKGIFTLDVNGQDVKFEASKVN